MAGINKVMLLGNLGKDPEIRHFDSGAVKANFSLATSETYKDREGRPVTKTEWHNIVLWEKEAKAAEKYLSKGKQVFIEGQINTRSYQDREGNNRNITEIKGYKLHLLGSRPQEDSGFTSSQQEAAGTQRFASDANSRDDADSSANEVGLADMPF